MELFKIADGRGCFYQWDLDQKILVNDIAINEVHFCNGTSDCSLVVRVEDGAANVPNILLQIARSIRVYAVQDDHTCAESVFAVRQRTKPADYVYTETEVKRYEDLEKQIEEVRKSIPSVPVQSVNGKTGEVQLTASDVGALPSDTPIPEAYTLPTATADTLGGVMVGDGLQIEDGVLFNEQTKVTYEETITVSEPVASILIDLPRLAQISIEYDSAELIALPRVQFFVNERICALSRKAAISSIGAKNAITLNIYKRIGKMYASGYVGALSQYLYMNTGFNDVQASMSFAHGIEAELINTLRIASADEGVDIPAGTITIKGVGGK